MSDDPSGLIREVVKLEMPKTVEGIVDLFRTVISKPYVEKIVFEADSPVSVTWSRSIHDDLTTSEPDLPWEIVLSRIDLKEMRQTSAKKVLVALGKLTVRTGLVPTHIICGDLDSLGEWLGVYLDSVGMYLGMSLAVSQELNADVVVFCLSPTRVSSREDITTGFKVVIPEMKNE